MWQLSRRSALRYVPVVASLSVAAYGAASRPHARAIDPIASLQSKIESGVNLKFDSKHGYLKAILEELNISPASQILVFSKTSFQGSHISPKTPRALYFNDDSYVGWVNGGDLIEIGTIDQEGGSVFYTLPNSQAPKPEFNRNPIECFACHGSRTPRSTPNLLIRSVYTDPDGYPVFTSGGRQTTPFSPFEERWGGWYVTGTHGSMRHMGNVLAIGDDVDKALDKEKGANVTDLKGFVDLKPYLTAESDIVALMVAEHQIHVQNALNRAVVSRGSVDTLLSAMLSSNEAKLSSEVKGGKAFETAYLAQGPKDRKGRSLREFDLKTRLYKYRLSPMIYSRSFDALPASFRGQFYKRLAEVLSGRDSRFDHLSEEERTAIREILADTKPDFAKAL